MQKCYNIHIIFERERKYMNTLDLRDFSVLPDTGKDLTLPIQSAIDECAEKGITLKISKGVYNIGTILIKSNSNIIFEKGAKFSGIPSLSAYSETESTFVDAVNSVRGKALIVIHKAENVSISGEGIISGNGSDVTITNNDKPFLVRIVESNNIFLKNMTFERSISWCLHIDRCHNVNIENVKVYNRGCPNNDGIDIDSSTDVSITGCDISSGDDGICLKTTSNLPCCNITVKNCRISTDWGGFKIGTESVGDFKNITVEDCFFYNITGGGIKLVPVDGAVIDNVKIKNIIMQNCTGPIFIANGERNRDYAGEHRQTLSKIMNVEIDNIKADVVKAPSHGFYDGEDWGCAIGGVILSGTVKNKLENIKLSNMELSLPGGFKEDIEFNVREMGKLYPEFHRFDPVPAKGIYLRHAKNISIKNINMTFKDDDVRDEIYLEDAEMK